ncbi:hypothetical protein LTR66_007119 [Elasticomyces elasticus]|nr:hypothetical protein LTR66_007119 [Elasticomyces elasticus]
MASHHDTSTNPIDSVGCEVIVYVRNMCAFRVARAKVRTQPPAKPNLQGSLTLSPRSFSTSPTSLKKGAKAARESSPSASSPSSGTDDPFDFSTLETDIAKALEHLKNDLSKLRAGGRFNPEVLENLHVNLIKEGNVGVKLSDVAQVVPKGRTVQVIVGEKDVCTFHSSLVYFGRTASSPTCIQHVKPTVTAIQSSTLSLTPQPDAQNPLLLTLTIPPPTADSRRAAVASATKAAETANTSIRNARQTQQKKLRTLQVNKTARPDDLKKAGTMMEKVVEKGVGEVKRIVDSAKKVLESG